MSADEQKKKKKKKKRKILTCQLWKNFIGMEIDFITI